MRWIDNTKKKIGLNTLFEKASLGNLSNTKGKSITQLILIILFVVYSSL